MHDAIDKIKEAILRAQSIKEVTGDLPQPDEFFSELLNILEEVEQPLAEASLSTELCAICHKAMSKDNKVVYKGEAFHPICAAKAASIGRRFGKTLMEGLRNIAFQEPPENLSPKDALKHIRNYASALIGQHPPFPEMKFPEKLDKTLKEV